jgi:hypothetical protein
MHLPLLLLINDAGACPESWGRENHHGRVCEGHHSGTGLYSKEHSMVLFPSKACKESFHALLNSKGTSIARLNDANRNVNMESLKACHVRPSLPLPFNV